jgi:thiol-disulfide isomerase/thioredoxin
MNKLSLILLPLALLACRMLIPNSPSTPSTISAATETPILVETPVLEATAFAPQQDFTLVRIFRKNGDLKTQLSAEVKKAQALGQTPFVEFDATWCPPCQAITASLAAKNKLMLNAYSGIYLIHVDIDEWRSDISQAGFNFSGIPVFFALNKDGKPTGAVVDGGAWGEDIPENIAPVLTKFFHPHQSDIQG